MKRAAMAPYVLMQSEYEGSRWATTMGPRQAKAGSASKVLPFNKRISTWSIIRHGQRLGVESRCLNRTNACK